MKPLRWFLFALLFGACAFSLRADALAEPYFDAFDQQARPPMGILGLPLGTFAVIEGVYHPYGMASILPGFEIHKVNGKELDSPRHIPADGHDLVDGKRYVLHGFENGGWGGEPGNLPAGEHYGAKVVFCFLTRFQVTSVETIDGITAPGAKPLDPKVPLAAPDFSAKADRRPPIGILGLPLGTFAIIEVRAPTHPVLMESPFEVVSVNGKASPLPLITVQNLPELKDGAHATLHGFECGEWGSTPKLPESEYPRSAPQVQKPFQFFHKFVLTSPPSKPGN